MVKNLYSYLFQASYFYYLEQNNIIRGGQRRVLDDRRRTKSITYLDLIREQIRMPDISTWDLLLTTTEPLAKEYAPIVKKLKKTPGLKNVWFNVERDSYNREERVYINITPEDFIDIQREINFYIDAIY